MLGYFLENQIVSKCLILKQLIFQLKKLSSSNGPILSKKY